VSNSSPIDGMTSGSVAKLARKFRAEHRRWANIARAFVRRHEYAIEEPLRVCGERFGSIFSHGRIEAPDEGTESIDLKSIPYKALVSLEQQHERRSNAQRQFGALDIDAEWKIPVKMEDVPWARLPHEYRDRPECGSRAMTLLSILDEVERAKAPSFVHFEDDIIFHPRISTLLPRLRVPREWKFIYLGGRNNGTKTKVSLGLARSDFVSDLHAVIIRSEMIPHVRRVLLDPAINSMHPDFRIATLHARYPAYLCRPNLAWQSAHSDDSGRLPVYCNYYANGAVKIEQGD
jgi:hypothetical protein